MSPRFADLAHLFGKAHGVNFNIVMAKGGKGVMNGLNAGDLAAGWGAGIQSGLSTKLTVSPEAPTMAELGGDFNADGYFMFVASAGLPAEARNALSSAIAAVVKDKSTKAGRFIKRAFGGAVVIQGKKLDALLAAEEAAASALMQAASR